MAISAGAEMPMRTLLPSIVVTVMVMLPLITIDSLSLRVRTSMKCHPWSGGVSTSILCILRAGFNSALFPPKWLISVRWGSARTNREGKGENFADHRCAVWHNASCRGSGPRGPHEGGVAGEIGIGDDVGAIDPSSVVHGSRFKGQER